MIWDDLSQTEKVADIPKNTYTIEFQTIASSGISIVISLARLNNKFEINTEDAKMLKQFFNRNFSGHSLK